MPFRNDGSRNHDNGFLQSIPDCSEGQERLAVIAVFRHYQGAHEAWVALEVLGLTETAEGMLAARTGRPPRSEPEPRRPPADLGS